MSAIKPMEAYTQGRITGLYEALALIGKGEEDIQKIQQRAEKYEEVVSDLSKRGLI